MREVCEWFACVYARRDGCAIQGWASDEGPLNGKKEHCLIYDVMCISAKCSRCGGNAGDGVCTKTRQEASNVGK